MSAASRELRSRAVKRLKRILPCAAGSGPRTNPLLVRWGGDPRADAHRKPGFGFLGRNAAKRAQKTSNYIASISRYNLSHEDLWSLTPDFVSRRSNSRRLFHQLAPRRNTGLSRGPNQRSPGCHGPHHGNV